MRRQVDRLIVNASEVLTGRSSDGNPRRGSDLNELDLIEGGAIAITGGVIVDVDRTDRILDAYESENVVDLAGRLVSPGFVDPHTHLVHGGQRDEDWESKATGAPAPNLAGGIGVTVAGTRLTSKEVLVRRAMADLDDFLSNGTTCVEAKTGYGLDRDQELRLLEITAGLDHPVSVMPTYLGAHMVPPEFADRRAEYVQQVIDTLPEARSHTSRCDIACDPMSFTRAESDLVGEAAQALGFSLRVHADQTGDAGGALFAVERGAMTAEHLDRISNAGLERLAQSDTVGVLFPGATYHLTDMTPQADPASAPFDFPAWAHRVVESGAALALSSDYNPGTSPSTSMPAMMRLAMRLYRLSYAQVWNMATLNAAAALGVHDVRGTIRPGNKADLVIWNVSNHRTVAHRFGSNLISSVIISGERKYTNPLQALVSSDFDAAPVLW